MLGTPAQRSAHDSLVAQKLVHSFEKAHKAFFGAATTTSKLNLFPTEFLKPPDAASRYQSHRSLTHHSPPSFAESWKRASMRPSCSTALSIESGCILSPASRILVIPSNTGYSVWTDFPFRPGYKQPILLMRLFSDLTVTKPPIVDHQDTSCGARSMKLLCESEHNGTDFPYACD